MAIDFEDLLKCSRGEMFGLGNPQLPLPPMLMFDSIKEISDDSGLCIKALKNKPGIFSARLAKKCGGF